MYPHGLEQSNPFPEQRLRPSVVTLAERYMSPIRLDYSQ